MCLLWLEFEVEVEVADYSDGFAVESRGWEDPVFSSSFSSGAEHCRAFGVGDPDFSVFIHNRKNADRSGYVVVFGGWGIGGGNSFRFTATQ